MGRGFSTAYRIILVIFSVGALVMTIMSAMSCAFVSYDHQYNAEGRSLQDTSGGNPDTVVTDPAATPSDSAAVVDPGTVTDTAPVDPGTVTDTAPVDPGTVTDTAPVDPGTVTDTTPVDPGTVTDTAPVDPGTVTDTATVDPAAGVVDPAAGTDQATVTDPAAVVDPETVTDPVTVTDPASDLADSDPAMFPPDPAPADTVPSTPETSIPKTMEDETLGQGEFPWAELNNEGTSGDAAATSEDQNAFGATGGSSTASAAEEPAAQVTGDAGLFCDSEQKLTVSNLWGGTISDFEAEIAAESDKNTSEELARNAVVAAAAFGAFAVFLLMIESLIGWRMPCERWIIGLVSVMACVSQGVTFLFFNSERYCDGDIVHEIMNQEPCVIGQGGIFSVVALLLYFIMVIMSCRLPQDDPYGLCCRKNRGGSVPTSSDSGSGKFGLLGSKKGEETSFKGNSEQDSRRERPGWLSEDGSRKAEEGDEII